MLDFVVNGEDSSGLYAHILEIQQDLGADFEVCDAKMSPNKRWLKILPVLIKEYWDVQCAPSGTSRGRDNHGPVLKLVRRPTSRMVVSSDAVTER